MWRPTNNKNTATRRLDIAFICRDGMQVSLYKLKIKTKLLWVLAVRCVSLSVPQEWLQGHFRITMGRDLCNKFFPPKIALRPGTGLASTRTIPKGRLHNGNACELRKASRGVIGNSQSSQDGLIPNLSIACACQWNFIGSIRD